MGLFLYRKKRDFSKTGEPEPGHPARKNGFRFCVQKHDATRLHYDFRLELDGVLKSWAVTRGPSIDAADKRLAVRTEDHPVSYRDFEGTIPPGQYGGGTVMLWDEGHWAPRGDPHDGLRKGSLSFTLQGRRMQGGWKLVRMKNRPGEKRENWLLIKERDEENAKGDQAEHFLDDNATSIKTGRSMEEIAGKAAKPKGKNDPLKKLMAQYPGVQLATLVSAPPQGGDWLHEVKFDGYRILAFIAKGEVVLRTRNGNDWTARFPAIAKALKALDAEDAVLDGEAVLLDKQGISHFQPLQNALGRKGNPEGIEVYFFDLLHLNGKDLRPEPLEARKKKLQALLKDAGHPLHYSAHFDSQEKLLQSACGLGLEGIVSKRKTSPYTADRTKSWLKSKCGKRQEFIIIGFTAPKGGGRAIGALHLAYMSEEKLTYAGKVGTGFDFPTARKLYERLKPLTVKSPPAKNIPSSAKRGATWVEPALLCEASFTEWTKEGYIRHPSFAGLREDKEPRDVKRDRPLPAPAVAKPAKELKIAGIAITHPDRPLFEGAEITKGDLARYYSSVAPHILKDIAGRPLSLLRCPSGTKAQCFFQRHAGAGMEKAVSVLEWEHEGTKQEYFYIKDKAGLLLLVQMNVIEFHAWGAAAADIDHPRRLVFDLDPDEGVPFEAVKLAALDVRKRLKALKIKSFVKCTGGKGLHVTAPLAGKQGWDEVYAFAKSFAEKMAEDTPEAYTATMSKDKRRGKIFVDYLRNSPSATAVADYSVRARAGAPVALPLDWRELKALPSAHAFTIQDAVSRLKRGKPDSKRYNLKQSLPGF